MDNAGLSHIAESDRFRLLVDSVTDYAIYMLTVEGYVNSWNTGAQRFKGYRAEEIIGKHFSNFYTEDDRAAGIPARSLLTAEREGRFETEGWRVRKDGSRFWANVIIDPIRSEKGILLGFAKVTRDVTERKLTQQALQQSEQQFRLLVQGVTDYAIYMLDANGVVTNWNSGAQRIKGYSASEIVGTHFSHFYTHEDQIRGLPAKTLAIAASKGRHEHEGLRVRKDGSQFMANIVIDAIRDELGQLVGFAKVTRDITEKRAAEEELQRANTALLQSQKMEALGQLTGGVAHDFNNLLGVLSSGIDMLSLQLRSNQDARVLDSMRRAVERGAGLTQQLLSFARQQPLKTEACLINDVITRFESVLRSACRSSVEFDIALSSDPAMVQIDPGQLQTALLNLVVNASDAMPDGGKLHISTGTTELKQNEIGNLPAATYSVIRVDDNGCGMPDAVRERALEPFFTTKGINKGTGLGLSQVYGFITQSGGDVRILSKMDEGTSILLYLPITHNDDPAEALASDGLEKVLIVEDQEDLLMLGAELFRAIGYEVYTATSAEQAIDLLTARTDINILFSDVMMPDGMDGIQLAHWVRERHPHIRIVLASGYARPALQAQSQNGEQFHFINKPYQLSDLAKVLRRAA
ncbi:hybrid sensor histidine kinase/response regulator [Oxalicibacterium faecigallinarum]|uniref:histidine kinase n=1 Tax=Oxalicibacterium faecigallinarum TaxID=573741 RepID=A0A8J3AR59_9BURK|nr:PAS domain S-box protein [Oxalicibacterium faecigallinarum]GGI18194.1 histidine kinase [Oxalicibacterium faecigallinarum]